MPSPDLARLAEKRGMVSLLSDGIDRAKRGETSLMEVLRVAG
jgi:type II secretory ATPase GspE/PulE/Tfp pilus assembly ATPase PilB-like protein